MTTVFVYGTLTAVGAVDSLLDEWRFDGAADLRGLRRKVGTYPTLAPGGNTRGRLLVTPALDTLDAYEGIDRGLYVRVSVPITDGGRAWLYVGAPDRLEVSVDWPGSGEFARRVRDYIDTADVKIRRIDNR